MDLVKLDLNGFSVRKSQVERNFVKELIQAQYFIVHFVQNCNISSPFQFSIEYLLIFVGLILLTGIKINELLN